MLPSLVVNTIIFGYILSEILRILLEVFYADFHRNKTSSVFENIIMRNRVPNKMASFIREHIE